MTPPFVVPALKKHTATVIMAHGLGDNGAGWMMLAQNWRRRGVFDEVSFIFPNAPSIPITINFGASMPGWYDISTLSSKIPLDEIHKMQDEPGILKSRDYFNTLIKEEMDKGIKPSRIVFGGFSQGGAMALITGITSKEKLGGIFGLSTYLPLANKVKDMLPEGWPNKETPIYMGHGDADPVVSLEYGTRTVSLIKEMGMDVDFQVYPGMGHSSDPLEIQDLERYLMKVIPAESEAAAGL